MKAAKFLDTLLENGFGPFAGVPCSIVKELISEIENNQATRYYTATSEGEAVGIAAGLSFSERLPVVILQNDGFGNTVNPLSSLQLLYELPLLMIVTWRSEPGGKPDAPQHDVMGRIILDLLGLLGIPYSVLKDDRAAIKKDIRSAKKYLTEQKRPYAFIVRRGLFEEAAPEITKQSPEATGKPKRADYIWALDERIRDSDIILATTGYTGRELEQESKRKRKFYMAGSMGCITSIGLGIAAEHPGQRVYILDGDGGLLMKLGTLATIGHYRPKNLIHILFDNGMHESTGGQKTVSETVNFPQLALNSGYRHAESVATLDKFIKFLEANKNTKGPMMCHVKVEPGTLRGLSRPSEPPYLLREKFMSSLAETEKT